MHKCNFLKKKISGIYSDPELTDYLNLSNFLIQNTCRVSILVDQSRRSSKDGTRVNFLPI